MLVIGVGGQAQHGKDSLADYLYEKINLYKGVSWQRVAFAYGVKNIFSDAFGVSREFIEEWKANPETPPGFDMNVRKGLQFIGDGFRTIRSSVWVDQPFKTSDPKIISDVRYPNEWQRVYEEGGLNILVGRKQKLNNDPNGSEALIRPYVEWALSFDDDEEVNLQLQSSRELNQKIKGAPDDMNLFHLFVSNNKGLEEFYSKIDRVVIPFVNNFKFGE